MEKSGVSLEKKVKRIAVVCRGMWSFFDWSQSGSKLVRLGSFGSILEQTPAVWPSGLRWRRSAWPLRVMWELPFRRAGAV